jgi:hypothetical protein
MTFDDQLRRAFDTLSDRLRDELERQVHAAMDELAASARAERDAAIAAADAEREAAVRSAEAARDAARSAEAEREATLHAAATERQAALESAHAEHDAALRALEADRDAAIAAAQADRDAAVAAAEREREAAVAAAEREREAAVAAAAAVSAVAPSSADSPALLGHLAAGVRAMSQASSLTAVLQALMTAAGASGAIANVWLVRGQELQPWRHDASSTPLDPIAIDADNPIADAARSKAPARQDDVAALPLTLAGEVVAVLVTTSPQPAADADALEVLALYASRAIESITAFKTARALTRQPDRSEAAAPHADSGAGAADTGGKGGTGDINAEDMASAQRYARLLVSEIKLYHEAEVVEGRRDRDLATRLGGEIARARVMYEQRVPAHVRGQADYFHDELVRTLANGDPALLEVRS